MRRYSGLAAWFIPVVLLAAGAPLGARLSAQTIGSYERDRGLSMLGTVRQTLEKHYYDSTFHGIDLQATAAAAEAQIRVAQSNGQIFRIIAQFVHELGDSHTRFYPPRRIARIQYGWEIQMIGDSCYVVWVKPGSDAARQLRVGDRVLAVGPYSPSRRDFSPLLHHLYSISPTPVVTLDVEAADGARRRLNIESEVTELRRIVDLQALIRELQLSERPRFYAEGRVSSTKEVLVLRLGWFVEPSDIDRVMGDARKARTLILDLRGNPGGRETGLVQLVGHVFDRRMTVATIHLRHENRSIESKPVGHPFTGALFVLIDSRSASSSEVFARLVQLEHRGVVLGDRSAGAVMRSRVHELTTAFRANPYGLTVTDADVTLPDGNRLEGQGVRPDSLVLPTAADLAAGRDTVLALALTMAGYPTDAAQAGKLLPRQEEAR